MATTWQSPVQAASSHSQSPFRAVPHLDRRAAPLRHRVTAEDDVAVQVAVARRERGPLVAREGGEAARLVERVGVALDLVPQVPRPLVALVVGRHGGFALPADFGRQPAPAFELRHAEPVVGAHLLAGRRVVGRVVLVLAEVHFTEPDAVVGHGHEVQRHAQAVHQAVGRGHLLAAREAVRQGRDRRGCRPARRRPATSWCARGSRRSRRCAADCDPISTPPAGRRICLDRRARVRPSRGFRARFRRRPPPAGLIPIQRQPARSRPRAVRSVVIAVACMAARLPGLLSFPPAYTRWASSRPAP